MKPIGPFVGGLLLGALIIFSALVFRELAWEKERAEMLVASGVLEMEKTSAGLSRDRLITETADLRWRLRHLETKQQQAAFEAAFTLTVLWGNQGVAASGSGMALDYPASAATVASGTRSIHSRNPGLGSLITPGGVSFPDLFSGPTGPHAR